MKTSDKGLALIKRFEGFSPRVYICPAGKKTIGWGHVLIGGEKFSRGISPAKAEEILKIDVRVAERFVITLPYLTQERFDALVSFAFNVGVDNLRRSTLLKKHNRKEFEGAADQFMRWVYVDGEPLEGLRRRREEERKLYLS